MQARRSWKPRNKKFSSVLNGPAAKMLLCGKAKRLAVERFESEMFARPDQQADKTFRNQMEVRLLPSFCGKCPPIEAALICLGWFGSA